MREKCSSKVKKDKDIVNKGKTFLKIQVTYALLHQPLKNSSTIVKTERHSIAFVEANVFYRKSSLRFVFLFHLDLPIPTPKIHLGE